MISLIQFKQVLRNKRFILFTLFIPVTWYMILNNLQGGYDAKCLIEYCGIYRYNWEQFGDI